MLRVQSLATAPRQMYVGWIYRSDSEDCAEQQQNVCVAPILQLRVRSASKIQTLHCAPLLFAKKMECIPPFLYSTTKRSKQSDGGVDTAPQASQSRSPRLSSPMKSCCQAHSPPR